jgi:hypothetical protein
MQSCSEMCCCATDRSVLVLPRKGLEDIATAERITGNKRDYNPAKAIARWESEGGALRDGRPSVRAAVASKSADSRSDRASKPQPTKR